MVSDSWKDNYLPPKYAVVSYEKLLAHKDGLIILTACIGGPFGTLVRKNQIQEAEVLYKKFLIDFNDDFYPEISGHDLKDQPAVNSFLLEMSKKYGGLPVITGDCHYFRPEESIVHDFFIKSTDKYANDFCYPADCFYLMNDSEIAGLNFSERCVSSFENILRKITLHNELPDFINEINLYKHLKKKSKKIFLRKSLDTTPAMSLYSVGQALKISEKPLNNAISILKEYNDINHCFNENEEFRKFCGYYNVSIAALNGLIGLPRQYFPDFDKYIELDENTEKIIPLRRIYGELVADIDESAAKKIGIQVIHQIDPAYTEKKSYFRGFELWWNNDYEQAYTHLKKCRELYRDNYFIIGDCLYNMEKFKESLNFFHKFRDSNKTSYHKTFTKKNASRISELDSAADSNVLPGFFKSIKDDKEYKKLFYLLSKYVPKHLLLIYIKKPDGYKFTPRLVRHTFLFADISGYTALSNELNRLKKNSAEILTETINEIFENLIKIINEFCGIVVKFGGDALMVMFTEELSNPSLAKINAIHSAVMLLKYFNDFGSINISGKNYKLRIKIGISEGNVNSEILNYNNKRKEYYLSGKTINSLAVAEKFAQSGEIIVTNSVKTSLPESYYFLELPDNVNLSKLNIEKLPVFPKEFKNTVEPLPKISNEKAKNLCAVLYQFIPYKILEHHIVYGSKSNILAENRKITAIFINIKGVSEISANCLEHHCVNASNYLQNYFSMIMTIIEKYRGEFLRSDLYSEGEKLLIVFGCPVSYENDELRAAMCALEIRDMLNNFHNDATASCCKSRLLCRLTQSIGLNSGNAYVGLVGSAGRMEYTVMGDCVNIAARLMSKAPDDTVYAGNSVLLNNLNYFNFEEMHTELKGIKGDYKFYKINSIKQNEIEELQTNKNTQTGKQIFIGKQKEFKIVSDIIYNQALPNAFIHIIGPAGIGKSFFVSKIAEYTEERNFDNFSIMCAIQTSSTPFHVWINLLKKLFARIDKNNLENALHTFNKKYNLISMPLIFELFGLPFSDNDTTKKLSQNKRTEALFSVIKECIYFSIKNNSIFFIDDIHWIDEMSLALLNYLISSKSVKTSNKIIFVIIQRPNKITDTELWRQFSGYTEINIPSFSMKETENFISSNYPDFKITKKSLYDIYIKTAGNPFFISEFLSSYNESGEQIIVPEKVGAIILSRMDRLTENAKLALMAAAVIGREFNLKILVFIISKMIIGNEIHSIIKILEDENFVVSLNSDDTDSYMFRHDLTRDAVYSVINNSLKKTLHLNAGLWFELFENKNDYNSEILAYHFRETDEISKAIKYLKTSGDKAKKQYANNQAIVFYSQAIEICKNNFKRFPVSIKNELIYIYQARGLIFRLIGQYEKALEDFFSMLDFTKKSGDKVNFAAANNFIGSVYRWKGDQKKALSYCKKALNYTLKSGDENKTATCYNSIAVVYWYLGKYRQAIITGEKSISLRRKSGDETLVARGLFSLGNCYTKICDFKNAKKCFSELYEISAKNNEKIGLSYAYDGFAYCARYACDFGSALLNLEKAYKLRTETGDLRGIGYSFISIGEIKRILGNTMESAEYFQKANDVILKIQDKNIQSDALRCCAVIEMDSNNLEQAEKLIYQSLALSEKLSFTESIVKSTLAISELLFRLKRYDESFQYIKKNIKISLNCEMLDIYLLGLLHKYEIIIITENKNKEAFNYFEKVISISESKKLLLIKLYALKNILKYKNIFSKFSSMQTKQKNYLELLNTASNTIGNAYEKKLFIESWTNEIV